MLDTSSAQQEDSRAVQVLLVSSNGDFRKRVSHRLTPLNWPLCEAASGAEALEALSIRKEIKVLLLDPILPDLLAVELCGMVHQGFPDVEILTMDTVNCHALLGSIPLTSFSSQLTSVLHYEGGPGRLKIAPRTSANYRNPPNGPKLRGLVGDSMGMQRIYALTHMVASRDTTVLITGESGTGKDLIAQAIHEISPRRNAPFIVVNCAAIPEALLEAELFGYAKGAFTGAMQSRIGRIHAAQGGTIFLDEIGDMPLSLQSKILRFVEQGEVQKLGSNENIRVDVRVIAATNAELQSLVKQKLFREDLYYRLAVFPIHLLPLRERDEDVISLAHFFASRFCPGVSLSQDALNLLNIHKWPGNVRELKNVIERASIMAGTSQEISENDIIL